MSLIKRFKARQLEDEEFRERVLRTLGDLPGHPFHGNQYTHGGTVVQSKTTVKTDPLKRGVRTETHFTGPGGKATVRSVPLGPGFVNFSVHVNEVQQPQDYDEGKQHLAYWHASSIAAGKIKAK